MVRHLILLFLLVFASITISNSVRGEIFTESGLVDIPTGNILSHGIFGAGVFIRCPHFKNIPSVDGYHFRCDAVAIRFNFGLFDRIEVGLQHLSNTSDVGAPAERTAHLKLQLLKEQESGVIPSVAIGIENMSDTSFSISESMAIDTENHSHTTFDRNTRTIKDMNPSTFLAISKTFNLPRIHQFSGHFGLSTDGVGLPKWVFVGLSKEFQPAFARGDITTSLEFDGAGVNAGMRYITSSGLQVALGAETLNDPDELHYLAVLSWTNEKMLEQIDETRRLIKQATKLAVEAKRAITRKKASDKTTETPSPQ